MFTADPTERTPLKCSQDSGCNGPPQVSSHDPEIQSLIGNASIRSNSKNESDGFNIPDKKSFWRTTSPIVVLVLAFTASMTGIIALAGKYKSASELNDSNIMGAAWSSNAEPFSVVDPITLGFTPVDRPAPSKPGPIFNNFVGKDKPDVPLPTNSWYENLLLGDSNATPDNKVFQVPYIIDTGGYIPGVRSHACHVLGSNRQVMMTYEEQNGVVLGAVEQFQRQHLLHKHNDGTKDPLYSLSKLAVELEWVSDSYAQHGSGPTMRTSIVRGTPYTSMKYLDATPRLIVQRALSAGSHIVVDNTPREMGGQAFHCGSAEGEYSDVPVLVHRELKMQFDSSDQTWLVFVSEPTEFVCTNKEATIPDFTNFVPGVVPTDDDSDSKAFFELKATRPMALGMVRVALANNCTTGQNPEYCGVEHKARDQSEYEELLRLHSDLVPTARAQVQFTFPVEAADEEELRLIFNWQAVSMDNLAADTDTPRHKINPNRDPSATAPLPVLRPSSSADGGRIDPAPRPMSAAAAGGPPASTQTQTQAQAAAVVVPGIPRTELLMFALPHHQARLQPIIGSSNTVKQVGCLPTIYGTACPAVGTTWSLVEHLHRTSFFAARPPRPEIVPDIQAALRHDLSYQLPQNYLAGAGDTYFSGKMLAKLGRVLLVSEEVGLSKESAKDRELVKAAVNHLREGVEIWLNGSAASPLLYDRSWGGLVMCGCDYDVKEDGKTGYCKNKFPDCPALTDFGQNFGAGYYNDHHYHYGYHIYAAAVLARFDKAWGRKFNEHVMVLIRDIVNPSDKDPFFPTWRHKDWFMGHSWASGVVTIGNKPYPNGRNQESSSEAISAYEGVALYGEAMIGLYEGSADTDDARRLETAMRIRDMGRLLMATEVRSAITYWHVQAPGAKDVARVYPESYESKVVGMLWSMLAQEQTWFGNEQWKSYGIQLMPITVAAEQRDTPGWVSEMVPLFRDYCESDVQCKGSGWEVLVHTSAAVVGEWHSAWKGLLKLPKDAFLDAGGNGHSLSNSLWYVATRPDPTASSGEKRM